MTEIAQSIIESAHDWAMALNRGTSDKAHRLGIDIHSAAIDTMDWSVIDGTLAGVEYANTCDAIASGDMTPYEFLAVDQPWLVRWSPHALVWQSHTGG